MASELTAELAELKGIIQTDYYGHAEIGRLKKLLPALIAAAERARELEAEVSKWMQDHHSECAKVQELEEALVRIDGIASEPQQHGNREVQIANIQAIARIALGKEPRPTGQAALDELTAETERLGLYDRTQLDNDELNRQQANRWLNQEEEPRQ